MERRCRFLFVSFCWLVTLCIGTALASAQSISIVPSSLNFGSQTVGTSSAGQSVTVTNTGATSLTFTAISNSGTNPKDFAGVVYTCTKTLAPGASCTITVKFTPQRQVPVPLTFPSPTMPPEAHNWCR